MTTGLSNNPSATFPDRGSRAVVPSSSARVFATHERRSDVTDQPITVFADDVWPLHHIDHADHLASMNLNFNTVPEPFRNATKIYIFNILNTPMLRASAKIRRRMISPGSVQAAYYRLCALTQWLSARGYEQFAEITTETWEEYAAEIADSSSGRSFKGAILSFLCRIWVHNIDHPGPLHLVQPPWFDRDLTNWIGDTRGQYENRTEPIPPDVMADLLHASMALVDEYLSGALDLGSQSARWKARRWAQDNDLSVPAGKGQAVTPEQFAAFKQATNYVRAFDIGDVRTSAMLIVGYLTGMRPSELLHLGHDCLESTGPLEDDLSSTASRYRIWGRTFKNVLDEDGQAATAGRRRQQPWITIEPAARAIEALQLINPNSEYLFAVVKRTPDCERSRRGALISTTMASAGIKRLITKWNQHAHRGDRLPIRLKASSEGAVNRGSSLVFDDIENDEVVSLSRLRRTLAWHIANQPGGEIALGIQYGHLSSVTSLGYAGRAESGFPDEVEFDRLMSNWDRLQDLTEAWSHDEQISGPAADRLADGLSSFQEQFAGQVRSEAELKRFRNSRLHLIYDNPNAHVVCIYNPSTAACQVDRPPKDDATQTPDLTNCQSNCPNIAMLDQHVSAKARERDDLLAEAESLPEPLAMRNRQRAELLTRQIGRHPGREGEAT
ncbi:hypothetical protein ACIGGF_13845 [Rhodococcus sp. NPDC078407]|nr:MULTISPECIES: hypothetical protein [unclassified Rhodococcus (in: high G+C Gram-positive bacteria)]MDI9926618.1 hypothetical protein [Rhodococcus sp. IEGM 1341]